MKLTSKVGPIKTKITDKTYLLRRLERVGGDDQRAVALTQQLSERRRFYLYISIANLAKTYPRSHSQFPVPDSNADIDSDLGIGGLGCPTLFMLSSITREHYSYTVTLVVEVFIQGDSRRPFALQMPSCNSSKRKYFAYDRSTRRRRPERPRRALEPGRAEPFPPRISNAGLKKPKPLGRVSGYPMDADLSMKERKNNL
ncbi:hypothetical protein EVAR_38746_1 [Eumeta japonica]|uniref:Uncharacterized protein n=1 Tax=Eumeta variegata TaxID=151549 RepID=A0A4C1YRW0_EUMVA|nr:hypothetical protein EVAR_38746_1 [Eumeta japonica]